MRLNKLSVPLSAAALAVLAGLATPVSSEAGLARGKLYSTAAVNKICGVAQQISAATNLDVNNSIFSEWEGFVQSDAEPYSVTPGFPTPFYAVPELPDAPLTSTQHVIYGYYGTGNRDFPQVVSCKMKSAEYLVKTGLDSGASDQTCSAVNEYYVNEVVASLTNPEQAQVVMEPDENTVVSDETTFSGTDWTAGFPDNPYPVLYRETENGPLHVKSRALFVPTYPTAIFACNGFVPGLPPGVPIPSFCEPRKWGVRYCHLPAPEYIRAALTGEVDVPVIPGGP